MREQLHDLLLEETAALLDDDEMVGLVGEVIDELRVERVGEAEHEQRERAGEAELVERVLQIRVRQRGADEAERRLLAGARRGAGG